MIKPVGTEYLSIKRFAYSSQGILSYMLSEFDGPLWLGAISVQRVAGEGIVTGQIWKGEREALGRANLQVSTDIYDALLAVSTSPGSHAIQLTYDGETLAPLAVAVA
jgi:hypothetical protein